MTFRQQKSRNNKIIKMFEAEELSTRKIGRLFGLSASRIFQIVKPDRYPNRSPVPKEEPVSNGTSSGFKLTYNGRDLDAMSKEDLIKAILNENTK